jgi:hypothetical protein
VNLDNNINILATDSPFLQILLYKQLYQYSQMNLPTVETSYSFAFLSYHTGMSQATAETINQQ